MVDNNLKHYFRGKHVHDTEDNEHLDGRWVVGYLCNDDYINSPQLAGEFLVDPDTICECTGLSDKNNVLIFEHDIVKLVLPNGCVRYFEICIKNIVREVVCYNGFTPATANVEFVGVVFNWKGYDLLPCVETFGVPDYKMSEVVGNTFDNPELLDL